MRSMALILGLIAKSWGIFHNQRIMLIITRRYLNRHWILLVFITIIAIHLHWQTIIVRMLEISRNWHLLILAIMTSRVGRWLIWRRLLVRMVRSRRRLRLRGLLLGLGKGRNQHQSRMMIYWVWTCWGRETLYNNNPTQIARHRSRSCLKL